MPFDGNGEDWVLIFTETIDGDQLNFPVVDASQGILKALEVLDESVALLQVEDSPKELQQIPEFLAVNSQTVELGGVGFCRKGVTMFEKSLMSLENSGCGHRSGRL